MDAKRAGSQLPKKKNRSDKDQQYTTIQFLPSNNAKCKETAIAKLETSYKACTEPGRLSARYQPTFSQQKTSEPKISQMSCHQSEWPRDSEEATQPVPGVASEQARTPARREVGSELQAHGSAELKERSPTVLSPEFGDDDG